MEFEVWKKYVELSVQYGVPVAFTATTLGILIWVAMIFVRILKAYLPLWFETSIKSHERLCDNVDILTASILCIHDTVHLNYEGLAYLSSALHGCFSDKDMQTRLGIKSDTVRQLRDAHVTLTARHKASNKQAPGDEEAEFERQVEALRKRRAELLRRKTD